jgi:hypothetical protein
VADISVKKRGEVRRAKLYYLRERIGRATKVKERLGDDSPEESAAAPAPEPGPPPAKS